MNNKKINKEHHAISTNDFFNWTCIICSIIITIQLFFSYLFNFSNNYITICFISIVLFLMFYYLSKYKGLFSYLFWPFVLVVLSLLFFLWFEFNGLNGPSLGIMFTMFITFFGFDNKNQHYKIAIVAGATICCAILFEHYNLLEVNGIKDRGFIFLNTGFVLFTTSFLVTFVIKTINTRFRLEKEKAEDSSYELDLAVSELEYQNYFLETLKEFQDTYLKGENFKDSFSLLLHDIIELTSSELAFIGEIVNFNDSPEIRIFSICNPLWSEDDRLFHENNCNEWLEISGRHAFIFDMIEKNDCLFVEKPIDDFEGLVEYNLLIPIKKNKEIIGVISLQKNVPYDKNTFQLLEPFITSLSTVIQNIRLKRSEVKYKKELTFSREKALENVKIKSDFLIKISEELRTPLSLISEPVSTLLSLSDEKFNEVDVRRSLSLVLDNSEKILFFIDDILNLAKISTDNLKLFEKPNHLYTFIFDIYSLFKIQTLYRNIIFNLNYDIDKDIVLLFDSRKIENIINNLLSNAFKFTENDGIVSLTVSLNNKKIRIEIEDSGKGIHKDDLPFIFDRFYQTRLNNDSFFSGSGIGLSISKELAALHGFKIFVKSTLNKGSLFWFELEAKLAEVNNKNFKIPSAIDFSSKYYSNQPAKVKSKILFVEDHPSMREFVKSFLSGNYEVSLAENGRVAVEILSQKNNYFDLIITDLMMPEMDGFEFIKYIKSTSWGINFPIIVLTAMSGDENKIKALSTGVDEYLLKPFSVEELLIRIKNLLANYSIRQLWEEKQKKGWFNEKNIKKSEKYKPSDSNKLKQSNEDKIKLKEAEKIIFDHIDDLEFNVDVFARKMVVSKRQLYRFMKLRVGMTPLNFIKDVRLQYARKLLENKTYKTVREVANASGFGTSRNFSKNYEALFGKKPSSYFK